MTDTRDSSRGSKAHRVQRLSRVIRLVSTVELLAAVPVAVAMGQPAALLVLIAAGVATRRSGIV